MESEAVPDLATLSLNPASAQLLPEIPVRIVAENEVTAKHSGAADEVGAKKKKKKKKKANKPQLLVSAGGILPSQALVEKTFPWTAVTRPRRGRCAIAARVTLSEFTRPCYATIIVRGTCREIKAGEVVVAEQAVAFVPRTQDRLAVCHECCRDLASNTPSFECPSCKHAVYCQECEAKAIASHSQWCHVSQQLMEVARKSDCDEDLLRFVLALALKRPSLLEHSDKVSGGEDISGNVGTVKEGVIYPSFQDAMGLQTHQDKIGGAWKASVRKGCSLLHSSSVLDCKSAVWHGGLQCSVEELELLAMLVNTNAHGMGAQGLHNTDVALGIFPFVSMLNHSCWPNCCFASEGSVMYVRATQDIPKGSELCVSYINLYEPRGIRKQHLADTKHFDCSCQRCSEPLASSLDRFLEACVCTVRGCGGVLIKTSSLHAQDAETSKNSSSWKCDQCFRVLDPLFPATSFSVRNPSNMADKPWELVIEAGNSLAAAMAVYRERRFKDARVLLEQFLADFTGKLHPLNVLLFDALTPLMNCCRALGDAGEGLRVCRIILNCLEKVVPGLSLELANFYFCLGEMHSERADTAGMSPVLAKRYHKQAQETFQRVRSIREICLGKPSLPPF